MTEKENLMTQAAEDILKQALQLPPEDRLTVAQGLWNSVDPETPSFLAIDDALMEEIQRRDAEMEAGINVMTREEFMRAIQEERACKSSSTPLRSAKP